MAEIKNLKEAAERILKAIKDNENIVIFSDTDMDGVGSAIIMKEAIINAGGVIKEIYFPDREAEGYGISEKGLEHLKKYIPALFISLDCGIGNFKEVKIANDLGFEVLIVDHHQILGGLPEAKIIVDPKQEGDEYPFKEFANAGLTYYLAKEILKDKLTDKLREDLVTLAAIATIADMMPKAEDNEAIIYDGLGYLKSTWRPGLRTLIQMLDNDENGPMDLVYRINSFLNIRSASGEMPSSYKIFTVKTEKEAREIAEELIEKGLEKKAKIKKISEELDNRISGKDDEPIVFEGDKNWELVLLGVVASVAAKEKNKPIFLYKDQGETSHGSVRSPSGINLVDAMKSCSVDLISYGGHPQAAGFKIRNEHLSKFKECLFDYFKK